MMREQRAKQANEIIVNTYTQRAQHTDVLHIVLPYILGPVSGLMFSKRSTGWKDM